MENIEKTLEKKELQRPEIKLFFLRHSVKDAVAEKSQRETSLTLEGKKLAAKKYKGEINLEQSVAFGTPYKRTQETAAFILGGSRGVVDVGDSFEEVRDKLDAELQIGSKIGADKRLLAEEGLLSEYGETIWNQNPSIKAWRKLLEEEPDKMLSHYGYAMLERVKGIGFLRFLVLESDELAKQLGDKRGMTYSRAAKDIADIVKKYLKIIPRWKKLVSDESKKYKPTMQRYFVSHQGKLECFLAKVVEKLRGVELRNEIVDLLDGQGFDYTEGFQIALDESGALIKHKNDKDKNNHIILEERLSEELLDEIIEEGK